MQTYLQFQQCMNNERKNIDLLRSGSHTAFNSLYESYSGLLYGFIYRLTRSHSKTKDIVQDTFLKVWLQREQIDPDLSFRAWLIKIAQNRVVDVFRQQWKNKMFETYLCETYESFISPEKSDSQIDFDDFLAALNQSKKKLSSRQKEIFELCKEQGLTAKETAELLSISEQAVYNYLSQALSILRKELSLYNPVFLLVLQIMF